MGNILEIRFDDTKELLSLAHIQYQLLRDNAETAVANTVLLGVALISNDCPVDTGRARASIAGELADEAGVVLPGDTQAVLQGKRQSVTGFSGFEGRIGSNVEYIPPLEYGHRATGPKKLTPKQLRYLFASGILRDVKFSTGKRAVRPGAVTVLKWGKFRKNRRGGRTGQIVGSRTQIGVNKAINRRAGSVTWVKGKGMFRKNLPVLRNYFNQQMQMAISATNQGRSLRRGG